MALEIVVSWCNGDLFNSTEAADNFSIEPTNEESDRSEYSKIDDNKQYKLADIKISNEIDECGGRVAEIRDFVADGYDAATIKIRGSVC